MAESFAFELKLVDDVSRQAKKAADAVRSIGSHARNAQKALDFSKEVERASAALSKIHLDPKGYKELLKIQKEIAEHKRQLKKNVGGESFSEGLNARLGFGRLASAAMLGEVLAEGGIKVAETLVEAAHKVVEIFTEGISKAFEESGKEEKLKLNFKLSLGEKEGEKALEDVERFAKLTKFTPEQIAPTILKLRRAGFDQKSARQTIATGSDIEAAGGLSMQEYAEFAEHLKLKGGVTTKQLVSAGINAPQFYKDLGKKLGISAEAAEKRAGEGGKVDPQMLLNMITAQVNAKQGGAAGTGGKAESETFEARFAKLKDLPNQYFKKLVDSPAFKQVSDAFGGLLKKLDPDSPVGKRIMASITNMFEKIIGWFDRLTSQEGLDDLTSGIETAVGTLEKAVDFAGDLVDMLKRAAGVAETIAAPLRAAMDYGDHLLGRNKVTAEDFTGAATMDELKSRLRAGVSSGVVKTGDIGSIVNQWRNAHVSAPTTINVHGVDEETGKKAGAEVHKNVVNAYERAAQEGG